MNRPTALYPLPLTVTYAGFFFTALFSASHVMLGWLHIEPPPALRPMALAPLVGWLLLSHLASVGALAIVARSLTGTFLSRWAALATSAVLLWPTSAVLGGSSLRAALGDALPSTLMYAVAVAFVPLALTAGVVSGSLAPEERGARLPWRLDALFPKTLPARVGWLALLALPLVLVPLGASLIVTSSTPPLWSLLLEAALLVVGALPIAALWQGTPGGLMAAITATTLVPGAAGMLLLSERAGVHDPVRGVAELLLVSSTLGGTVALFAAGRRRAPRPPRQSSRRRTSCTVATRVSSVKGFSMEGTPGSRRFCSMSMSFG